VIDWQFSIPGGLVLRRLLADESMAGDGHRHPHAYQIRNSHLVGFLVCKWKQKLELVDGRCCEIINGGAFANDDAGNCTIVVGRR
jgi:hypothetical protein